MSGRDIVAVDTFNLSSLLEMATPEELKAAGVRATLEPSLVIEDFAEGWEKEWFEKGNGRKTFKLRSPRFQPPVGARLGLEIQSEKKTRLYLSLEKEKHNYRHTLEVEGGGDWQQIVLSPADFKMKDESLEVWEGLDMVIALSGGMQWDEVELRNLKWIQP